MGYVAVATLVGTGVINGWFLVGSPSNLIEQPYGPILLLKLLLFTGMLALAAVNRFWLVPALSSTPTAVDLFEVLSGSTRCCPKEWTMSFARLRCPLS
jgi:putative copper export protein